MRFLKHWIGLKFAAAVAHGVFLSSEGGENTHGRRKPPRLLHSAIHCSICSTLGVFIKSLTSGSDTENECRRMLLWARHAEWRHCTRLELERASRNDLVHHITTRTIWSSVHIRARSVIPRGGVYSLFLGSKRQSPVRVLSAARDGRFSDATTPA